MLVAVAIFFIYAGSKVLVEIALGVASFTYGGLLGLFILGRMGRRPGETGALGAVFTGIAVMIVVVCEMIIGFVTAIIFQLTLLGIFFALKSS